MALETQELINLLHLNERREADLEKEYDSARKETRDLEQKYRNGIWEIRILTQPF